MTIPNLVNYCNSNYNRTGKCVSCENECLDGCEKCLESIHLNKIIRRYNCINIANFYVCKYIYKYSSEIDHLFQKNADLNKLDFYNILSIGCGPSTELYGILNYMQRNNIQKKINYTGCDLNKAWQLIHVETINIMQRNNLEVTLQYIYEDIFNKIDSIKDKINILILQYVISDMFVHKYNLREFINKLGILINSNMDNGYIILNDINLNIKARDYFDILVSTLRRNNINIKYDKYYLDNPSRKKIYPYGTLHESNNITSAIPRHILKYNPWKNCSSAQLIIEKLR